MSRYSLNLPTDLKYQAEKWAKQQGVSLNQFILWAVSEKVGGLESQLDDPRFPQVVYKKSVSGPPVPKIRGTNCWALQKMTAPFPFPNYSLSMDWAVTLSSPGI